MFVLMIMKSNLKMSYKESKVGHKVKWKKDFVNTFRVHKILPNTSETQNICLDHLQVKFKYSIQHVILTCLSAMSHLFTTPALLIYTKTHYSYLLVWG